MQTDIPEIRFTRGAINLSKRTDEWWLGAPRVMKSDGSVIIEEALSDSNVDALHHAQMTNARVTFVLGAGDDPVRVEGTVVSAVSSTSGGWITHDVELQDVDLVGAPKPHGQLALL